MIIVPEQGGLLLVRQRDHAHSSGQIAAAWQRPHFLEESIWQRFVRAVANHDEGWLQAEQQPWVDQQGQPVPFKQVPVGSHIEIWRRSIALANQQDLFAGLMVALHARWLYVHYGNEQTDAQRVLAQGFIDELAQRIDHAINQLTGQSAAMAQVMTPRLLDAVRCLMTFFDAMSLALVGGLAWFDRFEKLCFGDRCEPIQLARTGQRVTLRPWPFAQPEVSVQMAGVRVWQTHFDSSQALLEAMAAGEKVDLLWGLTAGDSLS